MSIKKWIHEAQQHYNKRDKILWLNDFISWKEYAAYYIAFEAHKGQLDDEGECYFTAHLCHVHNILENTIDRSEENEDIFIAALLHDSLEDTDLTYNDLYLAFGKRVADLVNEVTHEGQKDQYGYYFPRLHSRDAIMIKLADRLSNISRMGNWDEKRQAQYLKRTQFWKDGSDR